jgi:hypothetical protein
MPGFFIQLQDNRLVDRCSQVCLEVYGKSEIFLFHHRRYKGSQTPDYRIQYLLAKAVIFMIGSDSIFLNSEN